jgi:endoribonuclease Dicer
VDVVGVGGGGEGEGEGGGENRGLVSVPAGLMLGTPQVVCAVRVHGLTLAHAVAASSRYGKIAAAKKAIKMLEGMEVDEFRKAYGCACVVREGEGEVQDGDHGSAI